ncbi:MAG: enoyl-CoA hydratase-related protein [Alphaproteobacteria bacterium]|jgi:enoyl-CoA hydratase/carnithine racemase|nr:enoyl-CoA hydratase-related protein [Alphaproteobacteria bacterium]
MAAELVEVAVSDGVACLKLANPPLNLVSLDLTQQLSDTLDRLADDPAARVLVVTGASRGAKAFCAGSHIGEFDDYMTPGAVLEKKLVFENQTYSKLDDFPKPTIAALNGLAFGGGLEMAVCCDILIAAETAQLGLPEIKLGLFPGSGGTVRVTRRVGEGRAKEMMFTGDPISAQTALDWGLVNRVVARDRVLPEAMAMAALLAKRPNKALQLCKQSIDAALDLTEDEAIQRSLALSDRAFSTDDCREGVRAFFAKEEPQFSHS